MCLFQGQCVWGVENTRILLKTEDLRQGVLTLKVLPKPILNTLNCVVTGLAVYDFYMNRERETSKKYLTHSLTHSHTHTRT
jgi:hypothetical protein